MGKTYAQFFNKSVTNPNNLIPACGDRSVIQLDGRTTIESQFEVAKDTCIKRKYSAYQIIKGNLIAPTKVSSVVIPQGLGGR